MTLDLFKTLEQAKREVREGSENGIVCPCCGQFAKIYKRKLNSTMAAGLIWVARKQAGIEDGWVDVPRLAPRYMVATNQLGTVAHWGLIEDKPCDDSKKRCSGLWRVTKAGIDFVQRKTRVPEKVHLYDNIVRGWSDKTTDIVEALGAKFDYEELMRG